MTDSATSASTTAAIERSGRTLGLLLEPLDVLFFRDGRPFGAATRGQSQATAMPQTLAGALWTSLLQQHGCDFTELGRRVGQRKQPFEDALPEMGLPDWIAHVSVRGPWLARTTLEVSTTTQPDVLVPAPAVLHQAKKAADGPLFRLKPLGRRQRLPGWDASFSSSDETLRPLWRTGLDATEPAAGFLTREGLEAFLQGEDELTADVLLKPPELFDYDKRTGIAIQPDRLTAEEGLIYAASFLSLRRDVRGNRQVVLCAEVELPDAAPEDACVGIRSVHLGGEGRRVAVHPVDQPFQWPNVQPADGQKTLLLLTTPGLFRDGWKPRALDGRLAAAAVPGAVPVSGWDLARRGPKPTRFAVPAGSVYFLDGPADDLPPSLADEPFDQQQGWGSFVTGVWNDD